MLIRTIIIAALAVPAFYLALRYNLHMLQLNGYKNNEQLSWLKKNIRKQWVLIFGLILGILRIFLPFVVMDIFCGLALLMIIMVYRAHKHLNTKKNLVLTARVKRLLCTTLVLAGLIVLLGLLFGKLRRLNGFVVADTSFLFLLPVLANLINSPIEKGVGRWYINDAKRMLESVEGIKVLGVTGSYGKTSVKFYLNELLRTGFNVLITPESYNTPMGVVKTIRTSLKPTHEIFVCEMGARYVGDIKEICDIVHPDMGMITSIGPQHLETFGDMQHIIDTKFELADALPEGGALFLNGDNEYIREKAVNYKNKTFYFSESRGEGYCSKILSVDSMGTEFSVTAPGGEEETFRMRLVGAHNVINVAGAIAVANTLGISLRDLKIPVRRLEPVPHRMQLLERGAVTIIDDAYNSNPVGSKAAVETLAMFGGLRILITPGMVELGDREEEFNRKFGGYAAGCCDHIMLVGRENRVAPIREGALAGGFPEEKLKVFARLEDALEHAYSIRSTEHKYILLENDLPDNY